MVTMDVGKHGAGGFEVALKLRNNHMCADHKFRLGTGPQRSAAVVRGQQNLR